MYCINYGERHDLIDDFINGTNVCRLCGWVQENQLISQEVEYRVFEDQNKSLVHYELFSESSNGSSFLFFKDFSEKLNLKKDVVDLSLSFYKTIMEKQNKKSLSNFTNIAIIYHASKILQYKSIDMCRFLKLYNLYYSNTKTLKHFNKITFKLETILHADTVLNKDDIDEKYCQQDENYNEELKLRNIFGSFFDDFKEKFSNFRVQKEDYFKIIKVLVSIKSDTNLFRKNIKILFLICFLNNENIAKCIRNEKQINEKIICKLLNISVSSISKINTYYKKNYM
jgi:hypothetical protein